LPDAVKFSSLKLLAQIVSFVTAAPARSDQGHGQAPSREGVRSATGREATIAPASRRQEVMGEAELSESPRNHVDHLGGPVERDREFGSSPAGQCVSKRVGTPISSGSWVDPSVALGRSECASAESGRTDPEDRPGRWSPRVARRDESVEGVARNQKDRLEEGRVGVLRV
jgi:hypothetical protein